MNNLNNLMFELVQYDEAELDKIKVSTFQDAFRQMEMTHSLARRELYLQRIQKFQAVVNFPWREDQKTVITEFLKYEKRIYVVHAVFGSGKTTLLLGLLLHGMLHNIFRPTKVMFVSFNISIRNEIKRKLTKYGIINKVTVRTFDSIIYQICKHTGYKYLDLPNFDGKRKYVYDKIYDETCDYVFENQPDIIFIDECQDLEKSTMEVMLHFFPNSKFVLAGDIFQSIQKEPRESVLWHYVNTDDEDVYKIYMSETPRVPEKNLLTLKKALSTYYPEFKEKIESWHSSNTVSQADIEWRTLDSYSQIYDELEDFCEEHQAEETMILTFSSSITVKGAMGDVARLRQYLQRNLEINVNKNHKKMNEHDYFLTTANSSKGLERDYVICFLTFPLEKAFINLSDDIVVNLITVALTRAKKKCIMYVPTYVDKFSRVLNLFDACPKPTREKKIRDDHKSLDDYKTHEYLNLKHTVTELIRQSIIRYDTRIQLKEYVKAYQFEKVFDNNVYLGLKLETEEEKAFVGILIENLITSTWSGRWPVLSDYHFDKNPMYSHCVRGIKSLTFRYNRQMKQNINDFDNQFEGIFTFSQIHVAKDNKIIFHMGDVGKETLKYYWRQLRPKAMNIRPREGQVKIQANMKMRLLTGVADAVITKDVEKENKVDQEITIIEIKASQDYEWKDNALTQAILYVLMSGKSFARIILLNPFMNEKVCYYMNCKKILTLRNYVFQDIMTFNMNCFLAKKTNVLCKKEKLQVENCLFIDVTRNDEKEIEQVSVVRMVSPIKTEVLFNQYVNKFKEKEVDVKTLKCLTRKQKFARDSNDITATLKEKVYEILSNKRFMSDDKVIVYSSENIDDLLDNKDCNKTIEIKIIPVTTNVEEKEKEKGEGNEKSDEEIMDDIESYDSLCKNMVYLTKLFGEYRFV